MNELTQAQRFAVVFVGAALYVLFDNIKRLDRQHDMLAWYVETMRMQPEVAP